VLQSALRGDLAMSPSTDRQRILAQFSTIKTRSQARRYADNVRAKMAAAPNSGPLGG
jgi:hypothetical protein